MRKSLRDFFRRFDKQTESDRPRLIYTLNQASAEDGSAEPTRSLEFKSESGLTFALVLTLISLLSAIALYATGTYLETHFSDSAHGTVWEYLIKTPEKLSEAVLIAWLLNLSVEYIARKRHQRQASAVEGYLEGQRQILLKNMSKDVFSAVYEMNMPSSVFTTVRNSVFLCGFFRSNYVVDVDVQRVDVTMPNGHKEDRVKLRIRQQYDAKNISTLAGIQKLLVGASIDHRKYGRPNADASQFIHFSVQLLNHLGEPFGPVRTFTPTELKELLKVSEDKRFETIDLEVDLLSGWSVRVDVVYNQYHPTDGADMVCCMQPAAGIEINATVPHEDFELDLYSLHPVTEKDESEPDCLARRRWQVGPGILPGHGAFITWRPVSPVTPIVVNPC
jgi:hypothetical protein